MAAPKRHGSCDRHDRAFGLRLDSASIARQMAAAPGRMADSNCNDPYREQLCRKPHAQRLRDRSGHLVIPPVRDDLCRHVNGETQQKAELERLTTALGPFRDIGNIEALLHDFGGLRGLLAADSLELNAHLRSAEDAAKILAILSLVSDLAIPDNIEHPAIGDCASLIAYLQKVMGPSRVETFRVLFLDTRNRIIADQLFWTGTVSEVQIYPREIMRRALELDSSAFIAAHNHPSNAVNPSKSDIIMTRRLLNAASALNIAFHDHIIVSRTNYYSMRMHRSIDPWG